MQHDNLLVNWQPLRSAEQLIYEGRRQVCILKLSLTNVYDILNTVVNRQTYIS